MHRNITLYWVEPLGKLRSVALTLNGNTLDQNLSIVFAETGKEDVDGYISHALSLLDFTFDSESQRSCIRMIRHAQRQSTVVFFRDM